MTGDHSELRPLLTRELVRSPLLAGRDILVPAPELLALPVKAVQFGTGAFLRGFVEYFLDEANRQGVFNGCVIAISSTASGRESLLNAQDGLYTLLVEGLENGIAYRSRRIISSMRRALSAQRDWDDVLALAREPGLELVFSNTTEVGIAIDQEDRIDAAPPGSFPGKLTRFLLERGRAVDFDDRGVVILPCELIERNGEYLRELVLEVASRWRVERSFEEWIRRSVPFCNTLVDRIVPGRPDDAQRAALEEVLPYRDRLAIVAEPYRLFAIEAAPDARRRLPFAGVDGGIILTDDVSPYRERKVRILNGGHTLIASLGLLVGCATVREAIEHELIGAYLRAVLFEEIVPSLTVPNGEVFAHEVLERFANPCLRHALVDITLQHTAKMRVRVVPSIRAVADRTGSAPASLAFGFAAYLLLLRDPARILGTDSEGQRVRALWRGVGDDEAELRRVVASACGDRALWHADLASITGFVSLVSDGVVSITRFGVARALAMHLGSSRRQEASVTAPQS